MSVAGGSSSSSVSALLSTLKREQTYDFLRAASSTDLIKCLTACAKKDYPHASNPTEVVQFSDEVIKINRKEKHQSRVLILTNRALYNFEKATALKTPKRRIALRELRGIVLSRCSDELVLQVEDSYDYRYEIRRRSELLEMLSKAFEKEQELAGAPVAERQLMVIFSEESELKDLVITKDVLKNAQRVTAASLGKNRVTEEEPSAHSSSGDRSASTSMSVNAAGGDDSAHSRPGSTVFPADDPSSPSPVTSPTGRSSAMSTDSLLKSPKRSGQRYSLITHGSSLIGPNSPGKLAAGAPGAGYRAQKHHSVIVTNKAGGAHANLLAGLGNAANHQAIGAVDTADAGHAFRDPTSRLEGWLTKRKGSGKKWDRKYFILTNSQLQYYKPGIKGNVRLAKPVAVTLSADVMLASGDSARVASSANAAQTPLTTLHISSAAQGKKDAPLVLAFGSTAEASTWQQAFLHRNDPTVSGADYMHEEGWLLKQESSGKWVRRYVILSADRVWFLEMGLKGSVDFAQGVSAHSSNQIQATEEVHGDSNFAGRMALTRFAYRWMVSDSVRIFYLAADSEEDMNHWITSIDHVNKEHGKGGAIVEETAAGMGAMRLPDEFVSAVEQQAPEGEVSFVFTDVQSSTNLWEKVPDAMDRALEQHDRLLRDLLKKYNGYEVKTEGDAFMVTFFNALDAVLWCLEVQIALNDAEWSEDFAAMKSACKETVVDPQTGAPVVVFNGIRIRMGLHTGFPNCRRNPVTGRMDYFGPVVNRSARVSDAGHGGQIVCTQEVIDALRSAGGQADARLRGPLHPLMQDLGCHELKGIVEEVRIFQLMPAKLTLRTLPPIRTSTNEKKEKEAKAAAAAAGIAVSPSASPASSSMSSPSA